MVKLAFVKTWEHIHSQHGGIYFGEFLSLRKCSCNGLQSLCRKKYMSWLCLYNSGTFLLHFNIADKPLARLGSTIKELHCNHTGTVNILITSYINAWMRHQVHLVARWFVGCGAHECPTGIVSGDEVSAFVSRVLDALSCNSAISLASYHLDG